MKPPQMARRKRGVTSGSLLQLLNLDVPAGSIRQGQPLRPIQAQIVEAATRGDNGLRNDQQAARIFVSFGERQPE
jgi:hypothetical protein